jgi:hypothetical protein
VLKQDLLWSFGGAIGVTLLQALVYDYSVEDSLKTGLLFLVGTLVITYSKDLWRRRRASRSAYPESKK